MTTPAAIDSAPPRRAGALAAAAAVSALLHASGWAAAARLEPRPAARPEPVTVAFEVAPPPPPPASPRPRPAAPPPARRPIAAAALPPAPAAAPPPPSSEAPPPSGPPARAVPLVGITLSSTAQGGSFAVGVGNTLGGRAAEIAADPAEARPYASSARLSAQPRLLEKPEVPYPAAARRAGVAGRVVLLLRVGADGAVRAARVLAEPGAGLGEAARDAALRFRFSPALLDGAPVETELRFTYTFVLE